MRFDKVRSCSLKALSLRSDATLFPLSVRSPSPASRKRCAIIPFPSTVFGDGLKLSFAQIFWPFSLGAIIEREKRLSRNKSLYTLRLKFRFAVVDDDQGTKQFVARFITSCRWDRFAVDAEAWWRKCFPETLKQQLSVFSWKAVRLSHVLRTTFLEKKHFPRSKFF